MLSAKKRKAERTIGSLMLKEKQEEMQSKELKTKRLAIKKYKQDAEKAHVKRALKREFRKTENALNAKAAATMEKNRNMLQELKTKSAAQGKKMAAKMAALG